MSFLIKFFREAFFTSAFIIDIRLIDLCTMPRCIPFNVKNKRLVCTKSRANQIFEGANLLFSTTMTLIFVLRMIYQMNTSDNGIVKMLMYVGWCCIVIACSFYTMEYFRTKLETVLLLNAMHDLEKEQILKGVNTVYKGWNEDIVWFVGVACSYMGCHAMPLAIAFAALLRPCMDMFIGWLMLPCIGGELVGSSWTLWIPIFAAMEWYYMVQMLAHGVLAVVPGNYYVLISVRTFLSAIIRRKHAKFGMGQLLEYRRYQILVGMINICLAPVQFPTLIAAWGSLIVVGTYTAIRLFQSIPIPMYALFVNLAFDGFMVINFVLKECGKINEMSQEILGIFKAALCKSDRNWVQTLASRARRREVRSLSPLRIKMGSSNHFEIGTPLEISSLCVDNIINLLLAS